MVSFGKSISGYFQNLYEVRPQKLEKLEGWKPSFRVSSSGESLWIGGKGLDSAEETSSWLDSGSTRRGSRGGLFSRMRSKRAFPSAMVLWLKDPLVAISS